MLSLKKCLALGLVLVATSAKAQVPSSFFVPRGVDGLFHFHAQAAAVALGVQDTKSIAVKRVDNNVPGPVLLCVPVNPGQVVDVVVEVAPTLTRAVLRGYAYPTTDCSGTRVSPASSNTASIDFQVLAPVLSV
jgi:hypothetical protein